ncbi:MAG: hypothetical protein QNJ70_28835 [Xenococcaceae cyanobacterium MO_207.B15]|nr:hypothetical protein [Xenococcaceae cyanobacterium MO_207.B15]
MTDTAFKTKVPTACTCESCGMFSDYQDNGRGLCKVFDKVTYRHHSLTQDCLTSLPDTEDEVYLPEEDQDYCKYQPGDTVKLIDSDKDHSEWESFTVVGHKYNDKRYENMESCLTQPEWYVYIVSTTQPIPVPFWVAETEICLAEHSEFIATVEVF